MTGWAQCTPPFCPTDLSDFFQVCTWGTLSSVQELARDVVWSSEISRSGEEMSRKIHEKLLTGNL